VNRRFTTVLYILSGFFILGCAKIGSPYGGPKDETPPNVIKTKPSQSTVKFEPQKKIVITFDEYIQLENIYQEMILSPPVQGNVMAVIKGKDLVIEFPEEAVFDTTTYTLSFGNAIKDNNEGNILKGYEFVFSLKDYLDTMNIEGRIVSAFNHKPDEERMYVMAYKNLADSTPLLEKPRYITRANEDGTFAIHNMETGNYRLFGLKDLNSNMLFDLPEEQIAFSDSIINLTPERFENDIVIQDSALLSSIAMSDTVPADSVLTDTLVKAESKYSFQTELFFFKQEIKNLYLTNNDRPRPDQLFFTFSQSLPDSVSLVLLNYTPVSSKWYLLDQNATNDTLKFWLTDTSMVAMDSLSVELGYPVYDSLFNIYTKHDTLLMIAQKEKSSSVKGRKDKSRESKREMTPGAEIKEKITLSNNIKNSSAFDLNRKIAIFTPTPLLNVLPEKIRLVRMKDTLEVPVNCTITHDPLSFYRINIDYQPEELTTYRLFIPQGSITDIFGVTHDTITVGFKTQAEDYYGALTIHVSQVKTPLVLQLMDDKENLLMEKSVLSDQDIHFEYLYPKTYILKVIVDNNGNGRWDTGNYLKKLQPERVIYYSQPVEIRSNWEMDISWQLGD